MSSQRQVITISSSSHHQVIRNSFSRCHLQVSIKLLLSHHQVNVKSSSSNQDHGRHPVDYHGSRQIVLQIVELVNDYKGCVPHFGSLGAWGMHKPSSGHTRQHCGPKPQIKQTIKHIVPTYFHRYQVDYHVSRQIVDDDKGCVPHFALAFFGRRK